MITVEIRILASILTRIAHRSVEEQFSAHKAEISGLQYGILRTLSHESLTLSELSRRFILDPSTLVPVIQTLERKRLVTRNRDESDRRRWMLALTEEGSDLIRDVPLLHEDDLLFQCLGEMGAEKSYDLLNLLREVVKKMPEGAEMLESVTSRLYSLQGGENVPKPRECVMNQKDSVQPANNPMIRRVIRPRTRRTRNP
ncbi:MAG: MarR family transcriptional regulator [Chloroflexota bacterium]